MKALLALGYRRNFVTGRVLFQHGDPGDGMYVILCGEARVVFEGRAGTEMAIHVAGAGELLGELAVLDTAPRSATVIAQTDVEALFVGARDVQRWLSERPAAAALLLAELARRLRQTDERVSELVLLPTDVRVARRLWQRFNDGSSAKAGAALRLNQAEVAASLGLTRESVNKHLARLKSHGVVSVKGTTVTLLDVRALREAAAAD